MSEQRQFRKKSVVIEAVQWTGVNLDLLLAWGAPVTPLPASNRPSRGFGLIIGTLEDGPNCEAIHIADINDWIIRGVKGEFYPVKPEIFAATYEPVGSERLTLQDRAAQGDAAEIEQHGYTTNPSRTVLVKEAQAMSEHCTNPDCDLCAWKEAIGSAPPQAGTSSEEKMREGLRRELLEHGWTDAGGGGTLAHPLFPKMSSNEAGAVALLLTHFTPNETEQEISRLSGAAHSAQWQELQTSDGTILASDRMSGAAPAEPLTDPTISTDDAAYRFLAKLDSNGMKLAEALRDVLWMLDHGWICPEHLDADSWDAALDACRDSRVARAAKEVLVALHPNYGK